MLQIRGNEFPSLLFWGITAILTTVLVGYWQHKKRKTFNIPKKWREVGELSDLTLFPVKSGAGIKLMEAECTEIGIQTTGEVKPKLRDRFFIVYGEENGEFKTARTFPKMVFIKTTPLGGNMVRLSAPDVPDITLKLPDGSEKGKHSKCTIWNDVNVGTVDCGDQIAAWVSKYILSKEKGLRLGYYVEGVVPKRKIATKYNILSALKDDDQGAYPDLSSYMLMTEASVNDLKSRVPSHVTVTHRQFRPNFLVRGSQPYEEDKWQWIKIGDQAIFQAVKQCTRCVFTTIDPDTGVMEPQREPLRTLREYRVSKDPTLLKLKDTAPAFGIHYGLRSPGIVRIGDKVYMGEE